MSEPRHQGDIVESFMVSNTEQGHEVTDKLRLPGLAHRFDTPSEKAEVKSDAVKIPGVKLLGQKPRADIAETIVGLLNYRPGVVGFDWIVGEDHIDVRYVNGLKQRVPEKESEVEDLQALVQTILKSRQNITALCWDFGQPFVEVSYEI